MKKAVCIGINYFGTPSQLNGCINDAMDMRELLLTQYQYSADNVRMLCDAPGYTQPTRANILSAIAWLVQDLKAGDKCVLSYSGHGSYTRDISRDETDGRDEVMCALDGGILDDQLFHVLIKPVPHGAHLTCFFDCCHSGSITDLKYNYKCVGNAWNKYELALERSFEAPGNAVVYTGCYDHQVSMDVVMRDAECTGANGKPCGAFTHCMLSALRSAAAANTNLTHESLLVRINKNLKDNRFVQISQFGCSKPELFEAPFAP